MGGKLINRHFLGRTFAQQLQVAPEDLSARNLLEEVLVGEGAQLPPRDVDRPDLHLINVELLHHPHGPVDDLVRRPQHGIWGVGRAGLERRRRPRD